MIRPPSLWLYAGTGAIFCIYSALSLPFRRMDKPAKRRPVATDTPRNTA